MSADDIRKLVNSAEVVIFRSPTSDLGGLDQLLDRRGIKWQAVDVAADDHAGGTDLASLHAYTGHPTLPQVFLEGHFVGGVEAARTRLADEAALEGPSPRWSAPASLVSYAGLIPFIGLAAWIWTHHGNPAAAPILSIYAATILAFVGAVHWGWALAEHAEAKRYYWCTLPVLAGWIFASLPPQVGLILLAASQIGLWYSEQRWFGHNLPRWYRGLRLQLSFVAAACLLAAWVRVLF